MGDKLKGLAFVALLAVAGWQGYERFHGSNEAHRFGFSVEGPQGCRVQLDYGVGDARRADLQGLPFDGEPGESRGNPAVALRARVPASCGLQPEQVRCAVTRDGAPWRQAVARRTTDAINGDPNGSLCEVEADANAAAE
jgi:hypothetical protein